MENYIKKIKKWLENIKSLSSTYKRSGIRPENEWGIMLSVTFVIVLFLTIFATYFYMQVNAGKIFIVEYAGTSSNVKLNRQLLDKTIEDIQKTQDKFDQISNSPVTVPDPGV